MNGLKTIIVYDADAIIGMRTETIYGQTTACIDCGAETTPGAGSARCPECWKDKCQAE